MMSVLAGMTALPMQAMPVFAESTEIRNTTEDGSSFVGDWSCGASGSKTMTINADGTKYLQISHIFIPLFLSAY